jgi:hypothetical protein
MLEVGRCQHQNKIEAWFASLRSLKGKERPGEGATKAPATMVHSQMALLLGLSLESLIWQRACDTMRGKA